MTSHESALRAGGATVIVLPEGITRFGVKRGSFAEAWDPKRAVVVSQFAPHQPWSAPGAMTRNATVIGLSAGLVVVEARDTGGTLAAGRKALDLGRRVVALRMAEVPRGNQMLLARGATAASSRDELACQFDQIASDPSGAQLSLL